MTHFYLNRARLAITRESAGEPDIHATMTLEMFEIELSIANSYKSDWERQDYLRQAWEELREPAHQHELGSVLIRSLDSVGVFAVENAESVARFQPHDQSDYEVARFYYEHRKTERMSRLSGVAIRNAQNRAARNASITRLHLFALIEERSRELKIERDWCEVQA